MFCAPPPLLSLEATDRTMRYDPLLSGKLLVSKTTVWILSYEAKRGPKLPKCLFSESSPTSPPVVPYYSIEHSMNASICSTSHLQYNGKLFISELNVRILSYEPKGGPKLYKMVA